MRYVESLPHPVRMLEHVQLTMPDGVRLSARIWMPEDAEDNPVPAILEYIPYRKRDFTSGRDATMHPYVAGHGYACVRVDIRGSGDSEGLLTDEYLEQELQDGEEILRWIAAQPWCDGNIGMMGISWGGFNGLQIAARRPPELKAVITLCSTDDRYTDDVHYMGGCMLGDNQSWAAAMLSATSLPPDPLLVGDRWRDMWHQRLDGSGWWLEAWLRHQWRDAYWEHGSVCQNYEDIQIPCFMVSGWADGYSNSIFRLLEHLRVPRKGLIGPWSHKYPHLGVPGPAIHFLGEAVRWWDRWLKGIENGVDREPLLRVWMQDPVPPTMHYDRRPGRWVSEEAWPSPDIEMRNYTLGRGGLVRDGRPVKKRKLTIQSPLSVGLFAGKWCSFTATPDLPHDQREEDGGALVFESIKLTEPLEILGSVEVDLEVASNEPVAMIAARLSSVAPNDKATRVTFGLFNLTHRNGHGAPELLEPGKSYRVKVRMNEIAQVIPAGHRLRLSLSTSYWPIAWPPPKPVRLTLHTSDSFLKLPVRAPRHTDETLRAFEPAEMTEPPRSTPMEPRDYEWVVTRDLAKDISTLKVVKDEGLVHLEDVDLQIYARDVERYTYAVDDFQSVRGETHGIRRLERGDWRIETVARTELTCTEDEWVLHGELDAYEGRHRVFCRSYNKRIPRDHL